MAIYNGGLNIIAQDISGKEDKSNKVTTWSSTTTDTNYPSEKLVKDALDTKVNTADVLTFEGIQATTDLAGKVASANALKEITKLDLLWTNANPKNNFSEQTISLDLSKYKAIYLRSGSAGSSIESTFSHLLRIGDDARIMTCDKYVFAYRDLIVTTEYIRFYDGIQIRDYNNVWNYGNSMCIPMEIYGVK